MDREQKQLKQIKEQERQRIQRERDKANVKNMQAEAIETKNALAQQRDIWYQKYKDFAEKKKYKDATWAFKMFRLTQKLHVMAEKYLSIFDVAQAINQMMQMLIRTNECFKTFAHLSSQGQLSKIKRNLKRFRRSIRKFEQFADQIVDAIDAVFDDKKSKKKKDVRSDEEIFRDTIREDAELLSQYESENGIDTSTAETYAAGGSASGQVSPSSAPSGGKPFGIKGPND